MTYTRLPKNTPTILRQYGLKVKEIDGWQTRGRPARTGEFDPVGVLCHHTATKKTASNAAVVRLLIQGRSDLPGPLCHFGLGRDGTVYVIASGRANHAGKAKKSGTVSAGDGNKLYIGIEAFNDGVGEPWSRAQMEAYVLLCAVLSVRFTHNSFRTVRGHKETSVTGKVDPKFKMDVFRDQVRQKMAAISAPVKPKPDYNAVKMPPKAPAKWGAFEHLDPNRYMDYYKAILDASERQRKRAVDIDGQKSKDGTLWGLHWPTVGRNKLHDPKGQIKGTARIDALTDAEIDRLRSAHGKRPHKMLQLLLLAHKHNVRVELEIKVVIPLMTALALMNRQAIKDMHKKGLLQVKTLAKMRNPEDRLRPFQHAGFITIMSFTEYMGPGLSKTKAWPVTDYVRGTPKWV